MRIEIQQDVQRLPEEGNYHDERIQTMILDILFVYCKTNPDRGGYRQGMHELLAPIVHVVEQDAVDRSAIGNDPSLDDSMLEMIDAAYIEHDSYALFSHVMEHAQVFYEVKDSAVQSPSIPPSTRISDQSSAIVARSKFIHEVCLQKVDPELASHLTTVEILPQIFLMYAPSDTPVEYTAANPPLQSLGSASVQQRVSIRPISRALGHNIRRRPFVRAYRPYLCCYADTHPLAT